MTCDVVFTKAAERAAAGYKPDRGLHVVGTLTVEHQLEENVGVERGSGRPPVEHAVLQFDRRAVPGRVREASTRHVRSSGPFALGTFVLLEQPIDARHRLPPGLGGEPADLGLDRLDLLHERNVRMNPDKGCLLTTAWDSQEGTRP